MKEATHTALDKIVSAIVDELKPSRNERDAVHAAVSDAVILLRGVSQSFFDREAIRRTRDDARKIIDAITILESRIDRASPELRTRLKLDGALDNPELLRTITEWRPPTPLRMSETARDVPTDVVVDVQSGTVRLLKELRCLRKTCEEADASQRGTDQVKEWCARKAWELAWRLKANSESETSGIKSPDRVTLATLYAIAPLLYEAVAPDRVAEWRKKHKGETPDLRTACNEMHHAYSSAVVAAKLQSLQNS
jgi:hypothetical protein